VAERAKLALDSYLHGSSGPDLFVQIRQLTRRQAHHTIPKRAYLRGDRSQMLWTIFVVLLVLWLVGFIGFHVLGAYIHVLLLIALVVLILQLIGGRRTVV
jgi:hypothetical protein